MHPTPSFPLPIHEPIALLDATLLFLIQLLLAQHPELLVAPEAREMPGMNPRGLRPARRVLDAVREVHDALSAYRASLPELSRSSEQDALLPDDDILF